MAVRQFWKFAECPGLPKINLNKMLHGEDKVEVFKPMRPDGSTYHCEQKFTDF
jgi:hypothetical protein